MSVGHDRPVPDEPSPENLPRDADPASQPVSGADAVPADGPFVVPGEPRPPVSARSVTTTVSLLLSAILFAVLLVVPTGYAVSSPGPTRDVLGEVDGKPLISISGAKTYDSTGQLHLVTVSATGGPGYPSTVTRVLSGWLSRWSVAQPREVLFPPAQTREQVDTENQQEMVSSQENASVAALTELGYEVPATLTVAGTVEGSGAQDVVEKGDVIVAIDGVKVPDYETLLDELAKITAGDTITLTLRSEANASAAAGIAGALKGADTPATDANVVRFHVPDGATALPVLLGDLTKAGIDAIGVDVNRPTLDDVFLTLTGRSLRD